MRVAALAVGLLVVLAGCTGGPATETPAETVTQTDSNGTGTDGDPVYETIVFDHAGAGGPAIEGGIAYPSEASDMTRRQYVTLVTSEAEAGRFNGSVLPPEAESFVRNTSFGDSYLVVVQEYPLSSAPNYRVEGVERTERELRLSINDSSNGGTSDITVETLLVRVHGEPPETVTVTTEEGVTFSTGTGVVTRTERSTPTPTPVSLPYRSEEPAENVDEPRSLTVSNVGTETNGYHVELVYHLVPECRSATPPCSMPSKRVTVFEERGKLRRGTNRTVENVVARRGTYEIHVTAEVPAGDGSRVTVQASTAWHVDGDAPNALVVVSDDGVRIEKPASEATKQRTSTAVDGEDRATSTPTATPRTAEK